MKTRVEHLLAVEPPEVADSECGDFSGFGEPLNLPHCHAEQLRNFTRNCIGYRQFVISHIDLRNAELRSGECDWSSLREIHFVLRRECFDWWVANETLLTDVPSKGSAACYRVHAGTVRDAVADLDRIGRMGFRFAE